MQRVLLIAVVGAFISGPAHAQSITSWTATSGIEQFALSDIARGKPPVDASPLAWEGAGPMFSVARTRSSGPRWRRIEFVFADTSDFTYRSKLRELAADPEDGAVHLEGHYEYHRGVFASRLPAWLQTTIGVRGAGAWLSIAHHLPPANDISMSSVDASGAFVVAATLAPRKRCSLDVSYANGLRIGRVSPHGSGIDETPAVGAGWATDLALTGRMRVASRYAIAIRYFDRGDGIESSHRSFTTGQRQFSAGVIYAR